MGSLNTFDDRTIERARDKFTNGKRGSGDDPIATHAKIAQDVMLSNLQKLLSRAEEKASGTYKGLQGELDGDSLIDPFLSYDENVAQIQREYGVNFETYERAERDAEVADADEKARKHAREALRENFEAIEAGERAELVQDIREEFGDDFVADVLGRERDIMAKEPTAGAPEPTEPAEAASADGFAEIERPDAPASADAETAPESASTKETAEPASAQASLSDSASAAVDAQPADTTTAPEPAQPSAPAAVIGAFLVVIQSIASTAKNHGKATIAAASIVSREVAQ